MTDSPRSVDPTALDRLLEMTGGDPEFVDELVQTFLDDAADQFAAMRRAAEAGAIDELVRPAHSLKSNSANMGADRLGELCRALEADARSGSVDRAVERVAETWAEFEAARTELLALQAAR
jgi:HPt (histidine-containing phosphotransfer) domain-containing protein